MRSRTGGRFRAIKRAAASAAVLVAIGAGGLALPPAVQGAPLKWTKGLSREDQNRGWPEPAKKSPKPPRVKLAPSRGRVAGHRKWFNH